MYGLNWRLLAGSILAEGLETIGVAGAVGLLLALDEVIEYWMAHLAVCSKYNCGRCCQNFANSL